MSGDDMQSIGFAPVARSDARILILGSLPSRRSLDADEYYAHPQNSFWRIMSELVQATGDYEQRCAAVKKSGIALWDVLAESFRPGSLDADIDMATARINDFSNFFKSHQSVKLICFNGKKAAQIFVREGASIDINIRMQTLPSTSPAHASMSYAEKLAEWRAGIIENQMETT
jgi:TDG/mug DNA glycosylase family protein